MSNHRRSFIALLAAAGCVTVTGIPADVSRFDPPLIYDAWFSEVSKCSGLYRPLGGIDWYATPEPWERNGGVALGGYADGNIYLAEIDVMTEWVVKHEMLHYLLHPNQEHPSPPFYLCENQSSSGGL